MPYRAKFKRNVRPRATVVKSDDPGVVLEVNMDEYYDWLLQLLPSEDVDEIRKVKSKDTMNQFLAEHGIDFVFCMTGKEPQV